MGATIAGIGAALPSRVLTNKELEQHVDTSDEWIATRTGIKQRHVIADGENTSDLVASAAEKAIERSGVPKEEIDLMIVSTATPDTVFPSTACWAQPKIGLGNVPVFDVSAACSGFLYGYILADSILETGKARNVLAVGAEALTRSVNWDDRATCVLFGDGAGAAVISPSNGEERGLIAHTWGADGSLAELLWQPAGGTRLQATRGTVDEKKHTVHMAGRDVYKHAVKAMQDAVIEVMDKANLTADDIDLFVPHQANLRIINATADRLHVPNEKIHLTVQKHGNVSAASIPLSLADAEAEGKLKRGDLVLSAAFGAGFTWAAAVYRW